MGRTQTDFIFRLNGDVLHEGVIIHDINLFIRDMPPKYDIGFKFRKSRLDIFHSVHNVFEVGLLHFALVKLLKILLIFRYFFFSRQTLRE